MALSVVPLHRHKEYMDQCCKLINDEWKCSETERLKTLEVSCDILPTSLILLQNSRVIGHLKLSPIPSLKEACYVQSVVIERSLRGRGFGTILMTQAEGYCKACLHLKTIYLATIGQERFYSKLGYTECNPISIYESHTPTLSSVNNASQKRNGINVGATKSPPMPNTNVVDLKTYMKKDLF